MRSAGALLALAPLRHVRRAVPDLGGAGPVPGDVPTCSWADEHAVGYAAWTWDTWGTHGSLASSYDGTRANDYARWVHDFYVVRSATTYRRG